jgi:hypothetical protein
VAISHWPKIPNFVFADAGMLSAPSLSDMDWPEAGLMTLAEPYDRVKRRAGGIPLPRQAPWPHQMALAQDDVATALPVPAKSVFVIPEGLRALMQAAPHSHHEQTGAAPRHETAAVDLDFSRHHRAMPHLTRDRHHRISHLAGHGRRQVVHGRHGPLKHLVLVKKKSA